MSDEDTEFRREAEARWGADVQPWDEPERSAQ